jgi:hypothetical protein
MISVEIPLELANELLRRAAKNHDDICVCAAFRRHNKHLPPQHPAWQNEPACNCYVKQLDDAINSR